MNKIYLIISLVFVLFLTSCGTSKRAIQNAKVENKIEQQYQIYKGVKYKYGGTDNRGFDCSGFVQKVYRDGLQTQLPRVTKDIAKLGRKISKYKLKPGDLVFFRPSRRYRHVGIYVGNNMFIHSSTSQGITKSNLDNVYWKKKYKFAKRILKM